MKPYHIIIDTNVIFSGLYSNQGYSFELIKLLFSKKFIMHTSVKLILEYEEILFRNQEKLNLNATDIQKWIDLFCLASVPHDIYFLWRPYLKDAKDEHVLELAVSAECDFIVTFNKDDFKGSEKFGIGVLNPRELLELIGGEACQP